MENNISRNGKNLTVLNVLKKQSTIKWNSLHSLLFAFFTKHFLFKGKYLNCIMLAFALYFHKQKTIAAIFIIFV